jgi:hypothetical protein
VGALRVVAGEGEILVNSRQDRQGRKEARVGEHSAQSSTIFNYQTAVTLALGLKKRLKRYVDDGTM